MSAMGKHPANIATRTKQAAVAKMAISKHKMVCLMCWNGASVAHNGRHGLISKLRQAVTCIVPPDRRRYCADFQDCLRAQQFGVEVRYGSKAEVAICQTPGLLRP